MSAKTGLKKAYKIFKKSVLAKEIGTTYQNMGRWQEQNKLPRSEYSGETNYALQIETATKGKVTVEELLGHRPPHQVIKK